MSIRIASLLSAKRSLSLALGLIAVALPAVLFACGAVNLKITKTCPTTAAPGQNITCSITITQQASGRPTGVVIRDTLPTGAVFTGFTSNAASSFNVNCAMSGGQVVCTLPGGDDDILFQSLTINISFTIPQTGACGDITNTVSVTARETDLNSADNTASAVINVQCADLTVTKTGPATVNKGGQIQYSVTVTNAGPGPSDQVAITDPLPAGTTYVSSTISTGGSCALNGSTLTCPVGTLAANATATATITVQTGDTTACGILTNTATVAGTPNSNTANDSASAQTNVLCNDITIAKTATATVTRGGNITYTIVVTNGVLQASDVKVSDTLPPGTTYVSSSSTLGTCTGSSASQTVECTIGALAPNATATITITVSTNEQTQCGVISNTATVTGTPDTNTQNNSSTAGTTVICPTNDLTIVKTGPATVVRGNQIQYGIVVTNGGTLAANNVTVTDTLPSGTTFVSATSTLGTCSGNALSQTVTCSLGTVAAGGAATITLTVQTSPTMTCGPITNFVSVTGTPDNNTQNNTATAQTTVTCPTNDLTITKSATATVVRGDNIQYTVVVTNGALSADSVTMTDNLPAGTTFVSVATTSGTCTGSAGSQTVTCNLGTLVASGTASISITVKTDSSTTCGQVTNTATVTGTPDSNTANNSAQASTNVTCQSNDLAILKSATASVARGDNISYSLGVVNGPLAATNVVVTDTLPTGTTYVSATTNAGSCSVSGQTVTCTIGSMAAFASATINIVAKTDASTVCGVITNTAVVSGTPDSNTANNSSTASTTVTCATSDLTISKSATSTVERGNNISYSLVVTNGPLAASSVVVTDTLPTGTTFVSSTTSAGSCSVSGQTVTCTIGSMAANATATINVVAKTDTSTVCGVITNTAVVSGTPDSNTANNSASASTTVTCPTTDLTIVKTGPVSVNRGDNIGYTITVNNGSLAANKVVVTDTLPANVTFVSSTSTAGSCSVSGQTVTCTIGAMAANATASISITVKTTDATVCGQLTNTANVTGTPDSNTSNNSSTVYTNVVCPGTNADLLLQKVGYTQVQQGQELKYLIQVTNMGPAAATNVVVTDALPYGVTFSSATATVGSCTISGQQLTCNIGSLAVGASSLITLITQTSTQTPCATLTNTASVTGSPTDSNTSNNSASAQTNVSCYAVVPPPPPPYAPPPPYYPPVYQQPPISYQPPIYQQPPVVYQQPQVGYKSPPVYPITGQHDGQLYANVMDMSSVRRVSVKVAEQATTESGAMMAFLTALLGFSSTAATTLLKRRMFI